MGFGKHCINILRVDGKGKFRGVHCVVWKVAGELSCSKNGPSTIEVRIGFKQVAIYLYYHIVEAFGTNCVGKNQVAVEIAQRREVGQIEFYPALYYFLVIEVVWGKFDERGDDMNITVANVFIALNRVFLFIIGVFALYGYPVGKHLLGFLCIVVESILKLCFLIEHFTNTTSVRDRFDYLLCLRKSVQIYVCTGLDEQKLGFIRIDGKSGFHTFYCFG